MQDVFFPLPLKDVHLQGHVGETMDRILGARILSEEAAAGIYPEAIQAFRNRVDDRLKPQVGFWQGEFWGKWTLSAVGTQKYTGNKDLLALLEKGTQELLDTQREDGYIGTYHQSGFLKSVEGRQNWNVWCRKYTLWGLLDVYELLEDPALLEAAMHLVDHLMTEVGPEAVSIVETGRFHGMPSSSILTPLLKLYRLTGKERYLDYAQYIVKEWSSRENEPPDLVRKGLSGQPIHTWFPGPETWAKSYELLSCLEGLLELYRITEERSYLTAVTRIYRNIQEWDQSITGGMGRNDKFVGARFLTETENEVCDSVYWVRLSSQLLRLTGKADYADEIEHTLYNIFCGAMNPEGTWGVRRLCLSKEHWPAPAHCQLKYHHCCVDNLPRGVLQAAQMAVMRSEKGLYINLYIPGQYELLTPQCSVLTVQVETSYPEEGDISLYLDPEQPEVFELHLRIPPWAAGTKIFLNDAQGPKTTPSAYTLLSSRWQKGDTVKLSFPMTPRLVSFPPRPDEEESLPSHAALLRGPLVLALTAAAQEKSPRAIHDPMPRETLFRAKETLRPVHCPKDIWMAFEGNALQFCDYSSAGRTWDSATSDFRVWIPLAEAQSKKRP